MVSCACTVERQPAAEVGGRGMAGAETAMSHRSRAPSHPTTPLPPSPTPHHTKAGPAHHAGPRKQQAVSRQAPYASGPDPSASRPTYYPERNGGGMGMQRVGEGRFEGSQPPPPPRQAEPSFQSPSDSTRAANASGAVRQAARPALRGQGASVDMGSEAWRAPAALPDLDAPVPPVRAFRMCLPSRPLGAVGC